MLLEVLISIAFLTMAIATIGGQVSASLQSAEYTDQLNRALMLTEWIIAEMELGPAIDDRGRLIRLRGEEGEGTFEERYPGFGWRVKQEPTEIPNLLLITVEILHGNPEEKSVENYKTLHTVHTLRTTIPQLDRGGLGIPSDDEVASLGLSEGTGGLPIPGMSGGTAQIPPELEQVLAALPGPIQEILQRFLSGEQVPLDEIRMAIGELTTDDVLGLMMMPGVLSLLAGGGMSGLTGQMPGGGGFDIFQQMLSGAGAGGLQGQWGNLMGMLGGAGGVPGLPGMPGSGGGEGREGGEPGGEPEAPGSLLDQATRAGYDVERMRQYARQQGMDFDQLLQQAEQSGLSFDELVEHARIVGVPLDQFRSNAPAGAAGAGASEGGGDAAPVPPWRNPDAEGRRPRGGGRSGGNRFGR